MSYSRQDSHHNTPRVEVRQDIKQKIERMPDDEDIVIGDGGMIISLDDSQDGTDD